MVHVSGWTEDELETRASSLAILVRRAWRAVARAMYTTISSKSFVTQADINTLPVEWNHHADALVLGFIEKTYLDAAGRIADVLDAPDDLLIGDDLVEQYITETRNRIRAMSDDVWIQAREQIAMGTRLGEPIHKIASRVRDVTGVSTGHSLTIARTEVHAAYEAGSYEQAAFVDPAAKKQWLNTSDSRTRETHKAAGGQVRRIDEPFMVGGSTLRFPGDPLGSPDEVINCRCTVMYLFDMIDIVSDDRTSDDMNMSLVSAFKPGEHPRGKDGRFIKKTSSMFKALTTHDDNEFIDAMMEMSQKDWSTLTDDQKKYLLTKVDDLDKKTKSNDSSIIAKWTRSQATKDGIKVDAKDKTSDESTKVTNAAKATTSSKSSTSKFAEPKLSTAVTEKSSKPGTPIKISTKMIWSTNDQNTVMFESFTGTERVVWDNGTKKYLHQEKDPSTQAWNTTTAYTKKDAYTAFKNDTKWRVPDLKNHQDLTGTQSTDTKNNVDVPEVVAPEIAKPDVSASKINSTVNSAVTIPAGLKGNPGDPAKVTTGVIWGKHPDNTTILESSQFGDSRVVWNGKKYLVQDKKPDGTWKTALELTKKDAYAQLKGDTHWNVPGALSNDVIDVPSNDKNDDVPDIAIPTPELTSTPVSVSVSDKGIANDVTVRIAQTDDVTPSDVPIDFIALQKNFDNGKIPPDSTVAIHSDGLIKVVSTPEGVDIQKKDDAGNWNTILEYNANEDDSPGAAFEKMLKQNPSVATWMTPNEIADIQQSDSNSTNTGASDFISGDSFTKTEASDEFFDAIDINDKIKSNSIPIHSVIATNDDANRRVLTTSTGFNIQALDEDGYWFNLVSYDGPDALSTMMKYNLVIAEWKKPKTNVINGNVDVTPEPLKVISSLPHFDATQRISSSDKFVDFNKINNDYKQGKFLPNSIIAIDTYNSVRLKTTNNGITLEILVGDSWVTHKSGLGENAMQVIQTTPTFSLATWTEPKLFDGVKSTPNIPNISVPTIAPTPTYKPTYVPKYVVDELKNTLKGNKVGYWSKPDKIWDSMQEVLSKGQYSNYTPMQLIEALDKTTNTSKTSTPFKDKILKWTSTSAGFQYIGAHGVGTQAILNAAQHITTDKVSIKSTPDIPQVVNTKSHTSVPTMPLTDVMGTNGDISHIPDDKKTTIFSSFKNSGYSTYLDSPASNIFSAVTLISQTYDTNKLQALKVIDEVGAKKANVPNGYLYEKKISDWLKTPIGAAVAQGKPKPKPATPSFSSGITLDSIPSFEESSKYTYNGITHTDAIPWFDAVKAKYGEWTESQKKGLRGWTGGSYSPINNYLWGESDHISPTNTTIMKNAQAGMRPSIEPILLHRGQGVTGIGNAKSIADIKKMVGQSWKSDGFMATSVGTQAAFGGQVALEIEAPPGTPMAYIAPISQYKNENEMLLPAGLTYKIVSVTEKKSQYGADRVIIRVRIVPTLPEAK